MRAPSDYRLTYAVGDIHGRLDLLEQAIDTIGRHGQGLNTRIVFLGDYVDRGPDSRGVLQRLISLQRDLGAICLKGNHEDMMIRAFTSSRADEFALWSACGSQATLKSYGLGEGDNPMQAVPWDHIRWLARLPLTTADPSRIYVHAGLAPRTPFRDQTEATLLWIREAFLRAPAKDFEQHVVHGHTPLWQGKPDPASPEILPHRSNLDTAAFATGVLSIGVFDRMSAGGPVEVLSVQGDAAPYPLSAIIGPSEPGDRGRSTQARGAGHGAGQTR
jgi:serine/threonine protein phosphatase 1